MSTEVLDHPRLLEIEQVLIEFCKGNFSKSVQISGNFDIFDSFGAAINMLGEELSATTVNRDYFLNIFNEVDSLLLVMNDRAVITDQNQSALNASTDIPWAGITLGEVLKLNEDDLKKVLQKCRGNSYRYDGEGVLKIEKKSINVSVKINRIHFNDYETGFVAALTDISELRKKDTELVKAIVSTQESERNRLAQDLHDEMGQQISGLKMFVQVLAANTRPKYREEIAQKCLSVVDSLAEEIRSVCFNLMPRTLNEVGLDKALELLLEKFKIKNGIDFQMRVSIDKTDISKDFEVNVFRIVQEFINNSIKHSKCTKVSIFILCSHTQFEVRLLDDGIGFNKKNVNNGMGMLNIATRAKFITGEVLWKSRKNKGVQLEITGHFPLT
jgi:signal transduction histidine kinase